MRSWKDMLEEALEANGETLRQAMVPKGWYMPTFKGRRDQLVKGVALGLAEIERIDRAAAPKTEGE